MSRWQEELCAKEAHRQLSEKCTLRPMHQTSAHEQYLNKQHILLGDMPKLSSNQPVIHNTDTLIDAWYKIQQWHHPYLLKDTV